MENDLNPRLSVGRVDWWSILIYAALVLAGWLNIYAAVYDDRHASIFDLSQRYGMQLVWVGVSAFMADRCEILPYPRLSALLGNDPDPGRRAVFR